MRELVGQHSCAPGQTALLRVALGPALVTYRGRERESEVSGTSKADESSFSGLVCIAALGVAPF